MAHSLFVSYSRADNQSGRVRELIERIAADYREFAGEDLAYFLDTNDIHGMDDWRHNILGALRDSHLFLLILSPNYLKSRFCECEIVEFLKHEAVRAAMGQAVAPVNFVVIPEPTAYNFEETSRTWLAQVRRRIYFDLYEWSEEGIDALKRENVRQRLDDLKRAIHERITSLRRVADAPGNVAGYNPHFVGREVEMQHLHEAAGLGQLGVLSAVHGVGGLGKTALAIQYAYAYADFYPGGRWLVGCARRGSLATAIRTLDSELGVVLTDEEKLDEDRAARRVLRALEERARSGAAARAGERNPPSPCALLILDNVDDAALLHPPHTDLLTGRSWLHVLVTTRLGTEEIGRNSDRHRLIEVGILPDDDALRLIEEYQPQGHFPDDAERAAAAEIVTLLGGFTLAVEVVAVHLAERAGRTTCAGLLQRLKGEGLTGYEAVAGGTKRGIAHVEKLLTLTLEPTLATLNEPEAYVLLLAALLPPESIPLPWLRAVAIETNPTLGQDAPPGYDDPWLSLVNHLISLRLLQIVEPAADGLTPRVCRMHRLVQEVVKQRWPEELSRRERSLLQHIRARAEFLWDGWLEPKNRWELDPLAASAGHWLERDGDDGAYLASHAAGPLQKLGRFTQAERLNRGSVAGTAPDDPNYAARLNNLAELLRVTNRLAEAEPLYRRVAEIFEKSLGPDHPNVATAINNLAVLLRVTNRLAEAEPLYRRVAEIFEKSLGPDHPNVATAINNLAVLLRATNRLAEAEPLYRRVLAIADRSYGSDHPAVAIGLNSLAVLLQDTNRLAEAEPLCRRVAEIFEKSLDRLSAVESPRG